MRRFIACVVSAAFLTVGFAGTASAGRATGPALEAEYGQSALLNGWATYYENYFYTYETCRARGLRVTGTYSGNGEIPGTTNFMCYVELVDQKFSMDLYWS